MLTESQKSAVAGWYKSGATPNEIQKRLKSEFGVSLLHLELMMLLEELPPPEAPAEEASATAPDEDEMPSDSDAPAAVKVDFDPVTDPRYAASGSVTFPDGTSCQWLMDARGQLGLKGLPQGYQPSREDAQAFQTELFAGLQARGLI